MVTTLGPNCFSICRLNWSIAADLKFDPSVLKESGLMLCRFETSGAEACGSPWLKTAKFAAHAPFPTVPPFRNLPSTAIAAADWQFGWKFDRKGTFFRS